MNGPEALVMLQRRQYGQDTAADAIEQAQAAGICDLPRHRVTWTEDRGFRIAPLPWADEARRVTEAAAALPCSQAAALRHTGGEDCPARPLHDPCHTGCSEDGRTEADLTIASVLAGWREQVKGQPAAALPVIVLSSPEVPDDAPPGLLRQTAREALEEAGSPPWPDLGEGWNTGEILAGIVLVDDHLDEAGPQWAKACPEANMARRVGKAQLEAAEAMEELSLLTGENPRKGRHPEARERMLDELGDTAVAALLGIQSQVKDADVTWAVFVKALAKAVARVPRERPAPDGSDRS